MKNGAKCKNWGTLGVRGHSAKRSLTLDTQGAPSALAMAGAMTCTVRAASLTFIL